MFRDRRALDIANIDGLFSYAMALTRNRAEAEDLVQETYVRGLGAVGRLREESNVKSWLFTILRNIWFNQLRHKRNAPTVYIDESEGAVSNLPEPSKDQHEIYESKVLCERVRAAVLELSEEYREVILLREFEEMSYQDIAMILNCPQGTVMSRLSRARMKLRALLSETPTRT
jgi:RNA polymerase sigma-70 factor (ECF subfamily)